MEILCLLDFDGPCVNPTSLSVLTVQTLAIKLSRHCGYVGHLYSYLMTFANSAN